MPPPADPRPDDAPPLAARLAPPPAPPAAVERPRLRARLEEARRAALTLVAAPAGYGKSTLVAAWLRATGAPTAWLSLEEGDDDPAAFWGAVLTALEPLAPPLRAPGGGVREAVLAGLRHDADPRALAPLLRVLPGLPADSVLVLDDVHQLRNEAIRDGLAHLVARLPGRPRLVLIGRGVPPLPLARLRALGRLAELGPEELRFTREEAGRFLAAAGLRLADGDVAALTDRTEGWAAGLQLAALSLRREADPARFLAGFAGTDRHVLDYLVEEVLARQPREVQQFLLRTSILERLSAPLCEAVTERGGAQAMLERLERAQLFLLPLDRERRWYRYHPLFAQALRDRLRRRHRDEVPALHRRASACREAAGDLDGAVRHALAARDGALATRLLRDHAERLLWSGRDLRRLLGWIEALPGSAVAEHPRLALTAAWLHFELFADHERETRAQAEAAAARLETLLADPAADPAARAAWTEALAETDILRANLARRRGDLARVVALAERARGRLSPGTAGPGAAFVRSAATYLCANVHADRGRAPEAARLYREALRGGGRSIGKGSYGGQIFTARLVEVLTVAGRLHEAAAVFDEARAAQRRAHGPDVGLLWLNGAELRRERGELAAARELFEAGLELCRPVPSFAVNVVQGLTGLARTHLAEGDAAAARAALDEAARYDGPARMPWPAARLGAARARLQLAAGDLAAAGRWADAHAPAADAALDYRLELDHLAVARVRLAQGRPAEARALLARLEAAAERDGRGARAIEAGALRALALAAEGDEAAALRGLEPVLTRAAPEGFVRVFLDEGAPMQGLLRAALAAGVAAGPAGALLRAAGRDGAPADGLLTARELEVLRLVAAGHSNRAIAERLIRSVGTVKAHTSNIYGKLGVRNRTEAVARARELGLLG